ncbi:MAG: S8 family serine peptidase [Flavobacteriales bacterium]|nr:S8 family serine peptidase [Flavobacteriales bacterium]
MIKITTVKFRFFNANWKSLTSVEVKLRSNKSKESISTLIPTYDSESGLHIIENIPVGSYVVQAFSGDLCSHDYPLKVSNNNEIHEIHLGVDGGDFLTVGNQKIPFVRDVDNLGIVLKEGLSEERKEAFYERIKQFGVNKPKESKKEKVNRRVELKNLKSSKSRKELKDLLIKDEVVSCMGPMIVDNEDAQIILNGFVYVEFEKDISIKDISKVVEQYSFKVVSKVVHSENTLLVEYIPPNDYEMINFINDLASHSSIRSVIPCTPLKATAFSVPPVGNMTGFQWHFDLLEMSEVWQVVKDKLGSHSKFGSADVTISVVDGGIETSDTPPVSGTSQGSTSAVHNDFSGDVTPPGGGNIKKTYFTYDHDNNQQGNESGHNQYHGTNASGTVAAKATTHGTQGMIPNSRMMSLVYPSSSNGEFLANMFKHASGLETNWLNHLGSLYPASHKFPENFPALGQQVEPIQDTGNPAPNNNPNNYDLDDYAVEGPSASVFSNSWGLSSLLPAELNSFSKGMKLVSFLGRQRRGIPNVVGAGNSDDSLKNTTIFGQHMNMMSIAASTLNYLGQETKSPYSTYSNDYDRFIDVCAPSDSLVGRLPVPPSTDPPPSAVHIPYAYGIATSSHRGEPTKPNPSPPPATIPARDSLFSPEPFVSGGSVIQFTVKGTANANSSTFLVNEVVTSATGIALLSDGGKSELLVVAISGNASDSTVTVSTNFSKNHQASLLNSHSSGKKLTILKNASSSVFSRFHLFFGGTSAATPIVSGVVGLMLSVNPNLSWLEVRDILRRTAIPINMRHRGVSTIGSILNWRQFNSVDMYDEANALPVVNNEGGFIAKHQEINSTTGAVVNEDIDSAPINITSGTLNGSSRQITVASSDDFQLKQTLLIGWESTLKNAVSASDTTIVVKDGRGFKQGQTLIIGRDTKTSLIAVNGANIDVNSTDGFKTGDHILINGTAAEISGFGTTSNSSPKYGRDGSCSRIVLTAPFTLPTGVNPIGVVVEIDPAFQTEEIELINDGTAVTINPSNNETTLKLKASTSVQNSYNANVIVKEVSSEIRVIVEKIEPNKIVIDKPEFTHNSPYFITKGRRADYNHAFGFGRVNPLDAVTEAKDYKFEDVDLYIKNNLNDNGKDLNGDSIQSPDIWVRKQADLDLAAENDSNELNQNLEIAIPKVTSFDGSGDDDLEVDTFYDGPPVSELTTYVIRVDSSTAYSFEKTVGSTVTSSPSPITISTTFADIEGGASGVRIKFGTGTHDIADEWTIVLRPGSRQVYARVRNAGKKDSFEKAKDASARDVNNVRFSICVKTDKNLQLENYVLNNLNTVNPGVAFDISKGVEGTIILNENIENFSEPIKGKGQGTDEHHKLFLSGWPDNHLPPRNKFDGTNTPEAIAFGTKRLFALAEVLPHDGIVKDGATITDGLSPQTNNNISFREIGFYNAQFRKTGNIGLPVNLINIDASPIDEVVSIDLKALSGVFYKKNIHIVFKREFFSSGTNPEVAEYHYNTTSSAFEFIDPVIDDTTFNDTWITVHPNITGDVNTPEIQTVFETTVQAGLTTSKISIAVKVYNEENEFELYSEAHQIIVTTPSTISPESTTGTSGATEKQEVLFYTQPDLIASGQSATMSFGPNSSTAFNTTNLFTTAGALDPLAYAVTAGVVFAQDTVDGPAGPNATVNLILKPYDQGVIQGLKVKYFVYRGILKSELVANSTDLNIASVGTIDLVKNAVESYEELYKKVNAVASVPPGEVVGIESLGLDLVGLPDGTPLSAGFFGRGDNQPVPVKKGDTLGHFVGLSGSNNFGFDIILEDENLNPVFGDVRKKQNIITYTATGASTEAELTARSQILGYLDPCAFYGMHGIGGIVKANLEGGGTATVEEYVAGQENVYVKLLSPYFFNRNTIYLDIRGVQGKTYNFSQVVPPEIKVILGKKGGPSDSGALMGYSTNSWPIKILTAADVSLVSGNDDSKKETVPFRAYLRGKSTSNFKVYLSSGKPFNKKLSRMLELTKDKQRFYNFSTDIDGYAEDSIDIGLLNYPPDPSTPVTSLVSYYVRLKYIDDIGTDSEDQGSLLPKNHDFDNVFGPEPEFFANAKSTQMMPVGTEPYIDGANSIGFQGVVDSGVAKDSGRTIFYAVPKTTALSLRGSSRYKRLLAGSFDQSFFDAILGNKLPGLHKRKREIVVGGNTIYYLDIVSDEIIGNEISSPLNLMGLSITDAELATLKTNIANLDDTIYAPVINIRSKTSNLDDNGLGYLKAEIGFAGLNSSGAFTELPETLEVYGGSGTFLCSSAAAVIEPEPAVASWNDITWDKNNSGSPQVYRRLIVDVDRETNTNHKLEWELYDDTGNVQTYTGTPEDTWGRSGVVNAGDPIMLPAGTRVVVLGRRLLGGGANYKGNYTFYRVVCWYRNEYREGYVAEYSVLFQNGSDRVNTEDLKYMSDLMIAETFFSDIALELRLLEEFAVAESADVNMPLLWSEIQKNKTRWEAIKTNVQTQGNVIMSAYKSEVLDLTDPSKNKFRTSRRTIQDDLRRFKKLAMFNALESFNEYMIVSFDPRGQVHKRIKDAGSTTYPLISEKVIYSSIGEAISNAQSAAGPVVYDPTGNKIQELKAELTALKADIDSNFPLGSPILESADYLYIQEVLDPGNVSDPDIITVDEAAGVIFIGANGWLSGGRASSNYLNELVPSDQSFGHVDSDTQFSLVVNECNIAYGFAPPSFSVYQELFTMLTDTHDSGAFEAYSYLKDPAHTLQGSIISANGHLNVDPNASLAEVLIRIFLRNPEIGLFYIDEYLTEFGV